MVRNKNRTSGKKIRRAIESIKKDRYGARRRKDNSGALIVSWHAIRRYWERVQALPKEDTEKKIRKLWGSGKKFKTEIRHFGKDVTVMISEGIVMIGRENVIMTLFPWNYGHTAECADGECNHLDDEVKSAHTSYHEAVAETP